jgi:RNA polymerase sigma-70 factor (ECF subfamily)
VQDAVHPALFLREGNRLEAVDESPSGQSRSDRATFDQAFEAVYPALNKIAQSYMWRERSEHTLQATALVSETYLRLVKDRVHGWNNHEHLLGLAARSMRQVLVEHARARGADKRGANSVHLTLSAANDLPVSDTWANDLLALDDAIDELERGNPRQATIVQLRYFGGLSIDETAAAIGLSPATVKREWTLARLWLLRSLSDESPRG